DFKYMHHHKVYVRAIGGGQWRKLGAQFDGDVNVGWWTPDSRTIYFGTGLKATRQFFSLDVASGNVTQLTHEKASLSVSRDEPTNTILVDYADPRTPNSVYRVASIDRLGSRSSWVRLTNPN